MLNALVNKFFSIILLHKFAKFKILKLIFLTLLIFFCAAVLRLVIFLAGLILRKKSVKDFELRRSFECGFNTLSRGLIPFRLRFFLLANIFLIFDVELILLFPFMSKFSELNLESLVFFFIFFLLFLGLGLFHEWNQKILEWVK